MRALLYARYSTDRQRETSIEDQVRVCRERAAREGLDVVAVHADRETSGQSRLADRAGAAALLRDVAARAGEVVIVEMLERVSRDTVEQLDTVRRLEFAGVRIIGVADGYDSALLGRELQRGVRAVVAEEYIRDVARKTHRGLEGQFARGYAAGGVPYGYRLERDDDRGSRIVIDPERADVVRWIYAEYARGRTAAAIAADLNARQVPAPRGRTWAASAIYGHARKGTGIIRCELYVGRLTWNRTRWERDPVTRRRQRRERPPSEWRTAEREDLRIVAADLWHAVRARDHAHHHGARGRPARTLIGGLVRCGTCGGPVIATDRYRYGCGWHRDRGEAVCRQGAHVRREDLERVLLEYVRDELLGPDAVPALMARVRELARADQQRDPRAELRTQLERAERQVRNLVDAVAAGEWSLAVRDRLRLAEADVERLRAELASAAPAAATLLPRLEERARAALQDLRGSLSEEPERARETLRRLLGEVVLVEDAGGLALELGGDAGPLLLAAGGAVSNVVAGARFRISRRLRLT